DKGDVASVLIYLAPRPDGEPIYARALQDAQRAVRYLKANAEKYGCKPERVGAQGYSAGGCLTLITATNSTTQTYEPIDELDEISPSLAFAIPIYPAYVLDDGAADPNVNKGEGANILTDYKFDAQTPPMCLVHGDADIYSPLGSIEVYKKLRKMGISCELHIFSGAPHGFMFWDPLPNARSWQERCAAWLEQAGF
ncbi:MAG: alpha/beta hydrolase, partial [Thermoguttaceae bacterium]|nr:alpha/beta hydrolase [Thermoguttaceae bacterium]